MDIKLRNELLYGILKPLTQIHYETRPSYHYTLEKDYEKVSIRNPTLREMYSFTLILDLPNPLKAWHWQKNRTHKKEFFLMMQKVIHQNQELAAASSNRGWITYTTARCLLLLCVDPFVCLDALPLLDKILEYCSDLAKMDAIGQQGMPSADDIVAMQTASHKLQKEHQRLIDSFSPIQQTYDQTISKIGANLGIDFPRLHGIDLGRNEDRELTWVYEYQ